MNTPIFHALVQEFWPGSDNSKTAAVGQQRDTITQRSGVLVTASAPCESQSDGCAATGR